MEQLTLKDIYDVANELKKKGEDLSQYQIYLGNDDELNGIHCGWYTNLLDVNNSDEDNQCMIDMINEDRCNIELKNKGILIS
jgi:hypothetical protein